MHRVRPPWNMLSTRASGALERSVRPHVASKDGGAVFCRRFIPAVARFVAPGPFSSHDAWHAGRGWLSSMRSTESRGTTLDMPPIRPPCAARELVMRCIVAMVCLLCSARLFAQDEAVASFVDEYATAHHYSGSVLVQWHDGTRLVRSYGLASIPFRVANTPQTRFKIASITKLFTSVLILQLVEQHRVDLDQPIRTYLPDFAGEAGSKVTIQQLLNHTSGLPSFDAVIDQATALKKIPHMYRWII